MNPDQLGSASMVAIYSAMALYALAFIFFTFDLARRASAARQDIASDVPEVVSELRGGLLSVGTAVIDRTTTITATGAGVGSRRSVSSRLGLTFTVMAWALHLTATVLRGIAGSRVPWANMFEFTLTSTTIIVGVFLLLQFWTDLRFLGAYISGFVLVFLGVATTNYYVPVGPTPVPLQSYWLVIHVFVASLGTGFFALSGALSIVQLLQTRRANRGLRLLPAIPDATRLENLTYRLTIVGFVFWTFTLMAGAIWADHAWGRYWGWDTKETWTFIIWVVYAGYIHARATRGWRGSRSAVLAIVGFGAVMFNFTIVNIFFHGLHSYSGLSTAS